FAFKASPPTQTNPLSLHDALPILEGTARAEMERVLDFSCQVGLPVTLKEVGLADLPEGMLRQVAERATAQGETIHNEPFEVRPRSEEHTSELQSRENLVCRLLLEK